METGSLEIVTIVFGVLGLLVIVFLAQAVRVVPQAEYQVVERLGRFHKVLEGGLHLIVPFVDRVRARYDTQEQVIDIPAQSVITKDNVSITIDGLVFMRVHDAREATYEVLNLQRSIAQLAQTTLRAEIGKMELDTTLSSREEMNTSLMQALDQASNAWGAKVTRVEISDISVPEGVKRAMEMQLQASRERRAIEERANADKNATVLKAQGDLEKAKLDAEGIERMAEAKRIEQEKFGEGEGNAIEKVAIALKENPEAGDYLLIKDRIDAWKGIAASDSENKIVVPYDAVQLVGSLAMVTELAGKKSTSQS